jgi:cytoskeletal protein CcmA (bactofilin family)
MDASAQPDEDTPQQSRYRPRSEAGAAAGRAIVLGANDVIAGRLVFEGDVLVNGTLEGEVTVSGDLHVESPGTVKAKVHARNLSVRGTLEGEVAARERLLISGSGTVSGTMRVSRLAVEDGALLNGTITMERSGPHPQGNGRIEEG